MMTNISNLSPYSYNGIASGGASGKLYVPVNPANVIYAQFDHISGVAAKKGQHGVSITKIQILNTLIENLAKIKTQSSSSEYQQMHLSDEQVDVLIKNYQQQIKQAVTQAQSVQYTAAGINSLSGALFAIDA
ncbi:MAG: hypothetical protein ACI4MA_00695 [Treponema sp.]|nr:hypothetical protein [Spirochaetia bacterium]MDD7697848.1 hypothetical protein [Spirochaetia bacterium]MDY3886258.1 hypothetical protein [Treponema sp.]MDY4210569.1 hypothetical protein [Treponema sp.]